jgi:hypothetical protein
MQDNKIIIYTDLVKKILYGINENDNIDVSIKILSYLKNNGSIFLDTNINNICTDPYPNQVKKIYIYFNNDDNVTICDEINGCINKKLIYLEKKKIIIVVHNIISSIGEMLKNIINNLYPEYIVNIINHTHYETTEALNEYIYIIITNNIEDINLPKKYILWQVEQKKSGFFGDIYNNMLIKAKMIWEYSMCNVEKYQKYIDNTKICYAPLPFIRTSLDIQNYFEYDILFYGAKNERRHNILELLKNKYNICIAYDVFNENRDLLIKKSKIIINLHYYDECSLETARINEVLKYNRLVLSEYPSNNDTHNVDLYKNIVVFFDCINKDYSNINILYHLLDHYLLNYDKKIDENLKNIEILEEKNINYLKNNLSPILYPVYNYDIFAIHIASCLVDKSRAIYLKTLLEYLTEYFSDINIYIGFDIIGLEHNNGKILLDIIKKNKNIHCFTHTHGLGYSWNYPWTLHNSKIILQIEDDWKIDNFTKKNLTYILDNYELDQPLLFSMNTYGDNVNILVNHDKHCKKLDTDLYEDKNIHIFSNHPHLETRSFRNIISKHPENTPPPDVEITYINNCSKFIKLFKFYSLSLPYEHLGFISINHEISWSTYISTIDNNYNLNNITSDILEYINDYELVYCNNNNNLYSILRKLKKNMMIVFFPNIYMIQKWRIHIILPFITQFFNQCLILCSDETQEFEKYINSEKFSEYYPFSKKLKHQVYILQK